MRLSKHPIVCGIRRAFGSAIRNEKVRVVRATRREGDTSDLLARTQKVAIQVIIHKWSYIPYTGYHVLCGSEEWWKKFKSSPDWKKVTCKRCKKLKSKVFWPS